MNKVLRFMVLAVGLLFAGRVFAADVYSIDPAHSTIGFSVKHLVVGTTTGAFGDYQGNIEYDPAKPGAPFHAEATIQSKSINTNNAKRDEHLSGPDFFDVAKFPTITFTSKSFNGTTLVGDLTIKGVTKEVSIPVTVEGPVKGMGGDDVIGLSGQLTINRQDYGVTWNKTLDAGGLAVGNDVVVTVNLEAHKK